jgi:hypothetical protein
MSMYYNTYQFYDKCDSTTDYLKNLMRDSTPDYMRCIIGDFESQLSHEDAEEKPQIFYFDPKGIVDKWP